ncbi:MAG: T9SS type A sorting domain-containing protein [Elusimicrobia bacterium]|nr:T9SS type A sorting domain-containing protein [Elusimicrobiota bacterium]
MDPAMTSIVTKYVTLAQPPSKVSADWVSLAPSVIPQGALQVLFARLSMWTDQLTADFQSVRIKRRGTGSDEDVKKVYLLDSAYNPLATISNTSGIGTGIDVSLSSLQTLTTGASTYYLAADISLTADSEGTLGLEIASIPLLSAGQLRADTFVDPSTFPVASSPLSQITATIDVTTFTALSNPNPNPFVQGSTNVLMGQFTLQTGNNEATWISLTLNRAGTLDNGAIRLKLYYDTNGGQQFEPNAPDELLTSGVFSGASSTMTLSFLDNRPVIQTTPKTFFIAAELSDTATVGSTFQIQIVSSSSIKVVLPDVVGDANFSWTSDEARVVDNADSVQVVMTSNTALGGKFYQTQEGSVAAVDLSVDQDQAVIDLLKFGLRGSLNETRLTNVKLFKDANGDGVWQLSDTILGSGQFSGQGVVQYSNLGLTLTPTAPVKLFLVVTMDRFAEPDRDFYIRMVVSDVTLAGLDRLAATSNIPFNTQNMIVQDATTATRPIVVRDGPFSPSLVQLHVNWSGSVYLGALSAARYAIGTTSTSANVVGWTNILPTQTDLKITLSQAFTDGATYYALLQTSGTLSTRWSDIGASDAIRIDALIPTITGTLSAQFDNSDRNRIILTWPVPTVGYSGLAGYLVEYRTPDHPQWKNVKTDLPVAASLGTAEARARAVDPSELSGMPTVVTPSGPGTFTFRVRAVNGAGVISDTSLVSERTVAGALPASGVSDVSAFPNPFDSRTGRTTIAYTLAEAANVQIEIYSIFGVKVKGLNFSSGDVGAMVGANAVSWDGTDTKGSKLPKGMYIANISAAGSKTTLKIGLIH